MCVYIMYMCIYIYIYIYAHRGRLGACVRGVPRLGTPTTSTSMSCNRTTWYSMMVICHPLRACGANRARFEAVRFVRDGTDPVRAFSFCSPSASRPARGRRTSHSQGPRTSRGIQPLSIPCLPTSFRPHCLRFNRRVRRGSHASSPAAPPFLRKRALRRDPPHPFSNPLSLSSPAPV